MDLQELNRVYDILEATCKAPPGLREMLLGNAEVALRDHPKDTHEFRFQGVLGFGGKVWFSQDRIYVTCYPEDETPERKVMIASANEQLAKL